jgi:hypothetical protein
MANKSMINVIPKDTDLDAMAKYYKVLAGMSARQKSDMMLELNENMRSLLISGIKTRHPEFTHQQVIYEVIRQVYGVDVENQSKSEP